MMSDEDKTTGSRRRRVPRADEERRAEAPDCADVHATGRVRSAGAAGTDDADVHATGRAARAAGAAATDSGDVHATGRAARATRAAGAGDAHATGRAARRGAAGSDAEGLRPYERKSDRNLQPRPGGAAKAQAAKGWPDVFELDGVAYRNEGILSDSSGEAVVFTVSRAGKKYALKLYYYDPDHRPNHAILEKIKQLKGSGLLVNIVGHGEWQDAARPGERHDYELMDFCEGGSLDGVVLEGNEKALAEVAVRMASAIDFLARHGILHRDIKPGNFFYADKAKTQIVLADFGISVECPQGGVCKIDEMRSPVYAAPEFYTNVPGEPAEVGVESDYFSLGVSLLCLWMGKAKLTANESQLLRSKLNETLPMPGNLSPHMASLIKALTRLKMSDRATFDDIRRWAQGESLDTGSAAAVNAGFHVVFNSAKGQVAHSPAELAQLLLEDKVLGKKYLYSGRVTRWLEETGRNEIAVNVEEIVEKVYPANQEAGLMAVAYMLDPSKDYVDPAGGHHTDPKEISLHIFREHARMAQEVLRPDSHLMIYLHALKMDKTIAALREYVDSDQFDTGEEQMNGFIACYYLAVLLNPELIFPVYTESGWVNAETVDELLAAYHSEGGLCATNYYLLRSKALIVWLASRNPALAGKIRMLHDNATDDVSSLYYRSSSPYRIAYELDDAADLWFGVDPQASDRCYSIEQVGEYLNARLSAMVLGEAGEGALVEEFLHMEDTPVGDYLRARGEAYAHFLEWNRYCMDEDDEENSQKAGPYDLVIGAYKSVAGFLGHAPVYLLGGKLLTSPEDLGQLPPATVAAAMGEKVRRLGREGQTVPWLDAWLTVFFQENPLLDLTPKFTYEKETAKYVELIGKYAPKNYYYARYASAISRIDQSVGQLGKSDRSVKKRRNFFLLFGGIPTLVLFLGTWLFGLPEVNPIEGHFWTTSLICGVGILVFQAVMWGFWNAVIPGAVGGIVSAAILYAGFRWFPSFLVMLIGAVLLLSAAIALYYLSRREKVDTGGRRIRGDEFEYRQLDSLYYAYHQEDDTLDNVITKYSEWQQSYDDTSKKNISLFGWSWLSIVWPLLVLWYWVTPQVSGSRSWTSEVASVKAQSGHWVLGQWVARYDGGSVRIVCNIDSVADGEYIFGTMSIAGQAPVKARGRVYSKNDTLPASFSFYPEKHEPQKQVLSAEYDKWDKKMKGYYYDRKGIMNSIVFLSTPLVPSAGATGSGGAEKSGAKAPASRSRAAGKAVPASPAAAGEESEPQQEESQSSGFWEDTM